MFQPSQGKAAVQRGSTQTHTNSSTASSCTNMSPGTCGRQISNDTYASHRGGQHRTRRHTAVMTAESTQCVQREDDINYDLPCPVPVRGLPFSRVPCEMQVCSGVIRVSRQAKGVGAENGTWPQIILRLLPVEPCTQRRPTVRQSSHTTVRRKGHYSGVPRPQSAKYSGVSTPQSLEPETDGNCRLEWSLRSKRRGRRGTETLRI